MGRLCIRSQLSIFKIGRLWIRSQLSIFKIGRLWIRSQLSIYKIGRLWIRSQLSIFKIGRLWIRSQLSIFKIGRGGGLNPRPQAPHRPQRYMKQYFPFVVAWMVKMTDVPTCTYISWLANLLLQCWLAPKYPPWWRSNVLNGKIPLLYFNETPNAIGL
jgi:hypothetical protein